MVKGLEDTTYEERLSSLDFQLGEEKAEKCPYRGLQLPQGWQWRGRC